MNNNIYFIGPMGAGKTVIGKKISEKLGKAFFDSDIEIEKINNMSINSIFNDFGEEFFRNQEKKIVHKLCKLENIILSLGGGAILNKDNRKMLKNTGVIVYLFATVYQLKNRLQHNNSRPLLKNKKNIDSILCKIMEDRRNIYENICDIKIDTSDKSICFIVNEVKDNLDNLK